MQRSRRSLDARTLLAWVSCALLAFVLAGCGGGGSAPGDAGTSAAGLALTSSAGTATQAVATGAAAQTCTALAPGSIASAYTVVILDPTFDPQSEPIGHANLNEQGHVAFTSQGQARFFDGTSVRSLGTLGGNASAAAALNDSDQVTGFSTTAGGARHAFLWSPSGGMLDLGAPAGQESLGQAINAAGHVSGMVIAFPSNQPFLWTPQAGMVTQQDSATVFGFTTAAFLNAADTVVGEASTPSSADAKQAYIWTAGNGVQALGSLGGRASFPQGLNDANQVVGSAEAVAAGGRALHAFLWTAQAGMVDLGTLGGSSSSARAINPSGQIVGNALDAAGVSHAFLRNPGDAALRDLGTLGGASATANDINGAGVVVGGDGTRAFIWTAADGLVDLNARVAAAPAGLELGSAVAISDSGFVLVLSNQGLVLLQPPCAGGPGSVTGTVRFQSPAGALASEPSVAARASLHSVVSNTRDPARPSGHTVLRLDGFEFAATDYQQLLVQDGRAHYQGRGTLNGAGGFFFRITEVDSGQPGGRGDAVQIRIWHVDPGTQSETVDYDTGESPVATESGNIVVHAR